MPLVDHGKALQGVSGQDTTPLDFTFKSSRRWRVVNDVQVWQLQFVASDLLNVHVISQLMILGSYCTLVRISIIIGFWFDIINSIRSNDPIIMNPASPFAFSSVLFRFVLPCLPAVHVICQKNESHGVKTRHKDADWKWFERIVGADLGNIFLTIYFPMGRQPTQVTYGWAIGEIKVFDDPNCQNPLTPISATGYETTWGLPGDVRSMNTELWRTISLLKLISFNYPNKVQDIPCELQVGFTESDHWRTPLHRMARTLPHLRTQRGQARGLLQKSHWWRVACDLIGKRFPIVTVMIGVLEIGNDNLN